MLRPGQLFAKRYRIEARIAQGGMGVIYEAEHLVTEERVALKVLWPNVLGSKAAVESFQLEARIAARLGGEHIVRILDAGFDEEGSLPYLAMELLKGQTLSAVVRARGPLAPAGLLWAMRQLAKALDKAHGHVDRKGRLAPIVHRDLKPENLFLAAGEGGAPCIKVLDFGIAKVLSQSQKLSQELRGTPLFMASEQFEGKAVTPQIDVWAFGLVAFYLSTGRHYWQTANMPEMSMGTLIHEISLRPLEAPGDRLRSFGLAPPWPAGFDAWFLRCVCRNPAERFASAGMAASALAEALGTNEALALALPEGSPSPESMAPLPREAPGAISHMSGGSNDFAGGPRPTSAPREAAEAAAASGPLPFERAHNTLGNSLVQTLRPPRFNALDAARRRRRALAALAAVAAGTLLGATISYRYYRTAKTAGVSSQAAPPPGTLSSPEAADRPTPPASAAARPGEGGPSPGGSGPQAAPQEPGAAEKREAPSEAGRKRRRPPKAKTSDTTQPDPYEFRGE